MDTNYHDGICAICTVKFFRSKYNKKSLLCRSCITKVWKVWLKKRKESKIDY